MRDKCRFGVIEPHVAGNPTDILVAAELSRHLRYGVRRGGRVRVGAENEVDGLRFS